MCFKATSTLSRVRCKKLLQNLNPLKLGHQFYTKKVISSRLNWKHPEIPFHHKNVQRMIEIITTYMYMITKYKEKLYLAKPGATSSLQLENTIMHSLIFSQSCEGRGSTSQLARRPQLYLSFGARAVWRKTGGCDSDGPPWPEDCVWCGGVYWGSRRAR